MERHRGAEGGKASARFASPYTSLRDVAVLFWSWKLILLVVAVASPGPGYDTSTSILFDLYPPGSSASWQTFMVTRLIAKLTRWDAIYFATSSERGHLFEQEWAFSRALSQKTSLVARVIPSFLCASAIASHALAGILVSHISHFLAVIALYNLTHELIPCSHRRKRQIAFTAACLHIFSPGGLFLSAPNGESAFAVFNFWGMSSYVTAYKSPRNRNGAFQSAIYMIMAGVAFGTASMVRSNGLLSGAILAWDSIVYLPRLPAIINHRTGHELVRLGGILVGGLIIAISYALPQLDAYTEYCTGGKTRPWCENTVPSIYTWVQSRYWGVGFLKYWTLSNSPLFAIAAPMILVLLGTGGVALYKANLVDALHKINLRDSSAGSVTPGQVSVFTHVMARFAVPQLLLAVLATTSFHVQIINRISTGYPVWYMVLAIAIHSRQPDEKPGTGFLGWLSANSQWIMRAAVMYALIQGGLYASFLPPA